MKNFYYIKLFMIFFAAWLTFNLPANANNIGKTTSPDGKNVVNILLDDAGCLSYTVTRTGQPFIGPSSMGLNADNEDFSNGLVFESSNDETINENYTLPTGKTSKYQNICNETTFSFSKDIYKLKIVVRCYNDGIAFRYIIDGNGTINITGEKSEVQIPTLTTCWGEQYVSDYSTQYPARTWVETTALPDHKMCAPILVRSSIGDDAWALITESAVLGSYSASAMISGDVSEIGKFTYQPQSDASVTLPFTSPWRTVYIGNLKDLVVSNLNENLNKPTDISDMSWIKAGLSSWDWGGQDGSQTNDINVIKDYINMAYEMGWPYYTLDEGWAYSSYPLKDVTDYAKSKGVKVFIWSHSRRFENDENQIREILNNWKTLGFAGAKIDFFDGDAQNVMQKEEMILRVAADLHMMINFHGCTKPTGLRRTYPNLITSEAVYGGEQYFFNHLATPANHNVTLALTRNVIGPMDYTPTEFARKDGVIRHTTTWSHQTALATIYESGIQTMSDSHYNVVYNIVAPLLKVLPAAWDETQCIEASPDEYVTIARRSGDDWYIGSISKDAHTLSLPLSFLGDGNYTAQFYTDGTCPSDIQYKEQQVDKTTSIDLSVKATGGMTVRISKNPIKQPKFIVAEAEDGIRSSGSTLETDNNGNCSGGKFIGFLGKGNTLTNTVTVDKAGKYNLTVFFITQDTRNCYISVNNVNKTYYSFSGNGFSWGSDGLAFKTVQIDLNEGENKIVLGNDNDNCPNIDRLVISPSDDYKNVNISAINNLLDKSGYSSSEDISINLKNNSQTDLTNVPISYSINGGVKVTEQIPSLKAGESTNYIFSEKADFSAIQVYRIQTWVEPDHSQNIEGDMKSTTFANIPNDAAVSWSSKGSSIYSYSAQQNDSEAANKIIDNDKMTKWCETVNNNPWTIIQLPQIYDVNRFVMYDCLTQEQIKNVDQYDIYTSIDSPEKNNWTKIISTDNRKSENIKIDNITPQQAHYIKLVLTRPEGDNAIRVYGFDVFGTESESVQLDASGYLAYASSNNINYAATEGLTAYAIKYDGTNISLTEIKNTVPANTGVLLKGTPNTSYTLVHYTDGVNIINDLIGTANSEQISDNTFFTLKDGSEGFGFYRLSLGEKVPIHSAYLVSNTNKDFISINNTTGISLPSTLDKDKDHSNSYSISGQRVDKDFKGIIIHKGGKYIKK